MTLSFSCREGCGWIWNLMKRFTVGNAKANEIDMLDQVRHTLCDASIAHISLADFPFSFPAKLKATPFALSAMLPRGRCR